MTNTYERKYHKFKNVDPSTVRYVPIITAEILEIIEDKIIKDAVRFYRVRADSVLGIDLRHAVIRKLFVQLHAELIKIDKFERENSNDLRNYPWSGMG